LRQIAPSCSLLTLAVLLAALPAAAGAQDAATPTGAAPAASTDAGVAAEAQATAAQDGGESALPGGAVIDESANEIIVFAQSLRGQVDAPQPPLLELGEEEIAAYGVGSIEELIQQLAPQITSARGRGDGGPVFLVNGVRIASFRELRSYPPEAISRVEVFSEEVAQRYGYSADQRVVNLILKDNYESREIEAEYGQPWAGGYSTQQVEATYLRIDGPSRLNFNLEWQNSSLLTEAERGVVQAVGSVPTFASDPDPAAYRSLVSDSAEVEATANWATSLGDSGTSLSLNGTFERENSLNYQGLDTITLTDPDGITALRTLGADDPLTVDRRTDTYSLGGALNGSLGDWQLAGTVDASRADQRTRIGRSLDSDNSAAYAALVTASAAGTLALDGDLGSLPDAGYDTSRTATDTVSSKFTARGHPFYLPAGDVSVSFDGGYDWTRITSEDTRTDGRARLVRGNLNGGVNLGIPLTSVGDDVLPWVGDLTLNLSGGIDYLSDFGLLTDWSAGLTWGITDTLTFNGSYIARRAAPTLAQLGDPRIETPNVSIYDLSTGQTVLATVITGGNADLPEQSQGDWKLGLNWELPVLERSNFTIDYLDNKSDNVAAGFPTLTPTIEAAFPGRVIRDAAGNLLSVDQRPVTFARQKTRSIQVGLNLSGTVGEPLPEAEQPQNTGIRGQLRQAAAGGAAGGPGGAMREMTDEQRQQMAAFRQTFCSSDAAVSGAADLTVLPEGLQQRLRGEDGQIDPERLALFKERFCSREAGSPFGRGAGARGRGEAPPAGAAAAAGGPPPGGAGGPAGGRGPGGGGRGPGGGGPGGGGGLGGGGNGQGRWFGNLTYNYTIDNEVLVSAGGPVLDLLDGDALTGGGQPRHTATARGGLSYRGFGGFLSAEYTGSSTLDGSGLPGSVDLTFNDLVTFDVRTFIDFNQRTSWLESAPFLRNARLSFSIDNILDARQRVTDGSGTVPIRYQPFLVDPVGRSFEVELRKLF